MRTPSIPEQRGTMGYSASLGKWFIKNSPINQFAAWQPMDGEECSRLLTGIRSVDDPLMASGLRLQKANSSFHAAYQLETLFSLEPTTHISCALILTGAQQYLTGFDAVEGRDRWYAGTAIIDGQLMGPPLGVRSMTATCDDAVLLANVHVGGVPRSTDAGLTWRPTIDIDSDVHQVCAHPTRPDIVIAAAAAGLCISRDAGATWTIEQRGLHAPHCSAVAFGRNDIFVSASIDPFGAQAAVYRRPINSNGPLQPLGGGMPKWIGGIADTHCIATRGTMAAVIDRSGCLYVSHDDGATWSCPFDRLADPSGLHIC